MPRSPISCWCAGRLEAQVQLFGSECYCSTRRDGTGRLQHTKLYDAQDDDGELDTVYFETSGVPAGPAVLRWKNRADALADFWHDPELRVHWTRKLDQQDPFGMRRQNAPSTIRAAFVWDTPNGSDEMNLSDACLTLEHYVDWK